MSFLLDTDILSEHLRRPASLAHRFFQHSGRPPSGPDGARPPDSGRYAWTAGWRGRRCRGAVGSWRWADIRDGIACRPRSIGGPVASSGRWGIPHRPGDDPCRIGAHQSLLMAYATNMRSALMIGRTTLQQRYRALRKSPRRGRHKPAPGHRPGGKIIPDHHEP